MFSKEYILCLRRLKPFRNDWVTISEQLTLWPGNSLLVFGPAGSGKSAIAQLAAGMEPPSVVGDVIGDGILLKQAGAFDVARNIAFVPSNPYTSFSGGYDTVTGELDFHLRILGQQPRESLTTIDRVIEDLGLNKLLNRDPFTLSGGEATRVAIATALVRRPQVLVLDQIYDHLHPEWRDRIRVVLRRCCAQGARLIETHARLPAWSSDFTHRLSLRSGVQLPTKEPLEQDFVCKDNATLLRAVDVSFEYTPDGFKLGPLSLDLDRGTSTALIGQNGAGKSTLLRLLALIHYPQRGALFGINQDGITEKMPPRRQVHRWARNVQFCFQEPDDQIFLPTVRAEIAEAARLKFRRDPTAAVEVWASTLGLQDFLDELPANLPRSVRRLVCIAGALTAAPDVLLLDEPTAGLDVQQVNLLCAALASFKQRSGAVLFVSHDVDFVATQAQTTLLVSEGQLLRTESN